MYDMVNDNTVMEDWVKKSISEAYESLDKALQYAEYEKIFPNKTEEAETDEKDKNKPIEGLLIVRGLSRDDAAWTDGKIMDPANGKSYDCTIRLEDPNTLNVRGFLGFSFRGRTQVWKRK